MKVFKIILLALTIMFSLNSFAANSKEKSAESFAYYYYQKKKFSRAIDEYKNILKGDPRNFKARYNLGCLYAATKNYPSAIHEFKIILKCKSSLKNNALYNLSVVYGKYLKDEKTALKYYNKFKELAKTQEIKNKQPSAIK